MPQAPTGSLPSKAQAPAATPAPSQELRLERSLLSAQLDQLESTRRGLTSQLEKSPVGSEERSLIAGQLAQVNQNIAAVDNMLARAQAPITEHPATAITVVPDQPVFIQKNIPNAAFFWSAMFGAVLLLPFSIALSRRIWRRTPSAKAPIPAALDERLARMEQIIESTAIEVERIGEGQRFVTRLLTESEPVRALESARETVPRP
jgi:hypothetical protein